MWKTMTDEIDEMHQEQGMFEIWDDILRTRAEERKKEKKEIRLISMEYLHGRFRKPLGGFSADFRRTKFTRKESAAP